MSLINKMNVGNTDYDIQDRLMPDAIGQAGQVLKVKDDGSGLEFGTIESGGGKLYKHNIQIKYNSGLSTLVVIFYTSNSTPINTLSKIASGVSFIACAYTGTSGRGSVMMTPYPLTNTMDVGGVVGSSKDSTNVNVSGSGLTPTEITDTITEV